MEIVKTKKYLTTAEASEYTGISRSQLAKLRHMGSGCPYIRIGDAETKALVRYERSMLDDWMCDHLIRTTGGL